MTNPRLTPQELAEADKSRESHGANQPYASELDDRELEHAQKEKRPVSPSGPAATADAVEPD